MMMRSYDGNDDKDLNDEDDDRSKRDEKDDEDLVYIPMVRNTRERRQDGSRERTLRSPIQREDSSSSETQDER